MPSFTTGDGVSLTYLDTGGDGVPLVMLHGWGQTQELFRHQRDALGRRVVTLDFRGHGRSDKPRHGYRIARFAQDVTELLDHLGLDRVDALGHSMGVSVWWSFFDHHGGSRLRRFVAVDQPSAVAAVPWMDPREQEDSGAIFGVDGLVGLGAALAGPEGDAARWSFVRGMFSGDTDPAILSFVEAEVQNTPAYAGVPLLFDHAAQDWRDVLPRFDVPTLVVGCEGSHVNPGSQRYVAEHTPDARLRVYGPGEASSHFPFLENPSLFNADLTEFLGSPGV